MTKSEALKEGFSWAVGLAITLLLSMFIAIGTVWFASWMANTIGGMLGVIASLGTIVIVASIFFGVLIYFIEAKRYE